MSIAHSSQWRIPRGGVLVGAALTLGLAGCVDLPKANPFAVGPIDQQSAVAADVAEASRAPGGYPRFSQIAPVPRDVRPVSAWRTAVLSEWALKRATETEAQQLQFSLKNTEAWAQAERSQIPANELTPPAPDSESQTEAFAAAQRARATPPPSPH